MERYRALLWCDVVAGVEGPERCCRRWRGGGRAFVSVRGVDGDATSMGRDEGVVVWISVEKIFDRLIGFRQSICFGFCWCWGICPVL